jgi:hypothetical protein
LVVRVSVYLYGYLYNFLPDLTGKKNSTDAISPSMALQKKIDIKLDLDSNLPKIKSGRKASFFHTIEKILFEVGEKLTNLTF